MKAITINIMRILHGGRFYFCWCHVVWGILTIFFVQDVAWGQPLQGTSPSEQTLGGALTEVPIIGSATLPYDLSPWGMFLNADLVVKVVIIGLAFASIVTWAIWLAKSLELGMGKRSLQGTLEGLEEVNTLTEGIEYLYNAKGIPRLFAQSLDRELYLSVDSSPEGIKERIALRLGRLEVTVSRHIVRGTGILATIGSTAPFVGLFGTVWGIMNSFIGISEAQTTNLAVVSPGIAEALLVTAIGLITAIPAVIIYNFFARSIAGYRALLADISSEVLQLVSRDLDQQQSPGLVSTQRQQLLRNIAE
ncbi:MAG: tonB-system energizer ExbB [Candidatus Nitrosoglobus sp.]|jgi:biopolymer transport protein ExbB